MFTSNDVTLLYVTDAFLSRIIHDHNVSHVTIADSSGKPQTFRRSENRTLILIVWLVGCVLRPIDSEVI